MEKNDTIDFRRSADLLRVLAHPIRLEIMTRLQKESRCVNDIRELLDNRVSQPNLSQHLAILRRENFIDFYEDGKRRCYYIRRPELVTHLMKFLAGDYPEEEPAR